MTSFTEVDLELLDIEHSPVIRIELDAASKFFRITLGQGWLDNCAEPFKSCILTLCGWTNIKYRRQRSASTSDSEIVEENLSSFELPEDISNFIFTGKELTLGGIGVSTGRWVDFTIVGGTREAMVELESESRA